MLKLKLFLFSFLITTASLLVTFYITRPRQSMEPALRLVRVADEVFVTAQLKPDNVPSLKERGIKTIVDIRPDGEAADQSPSSEIEQESRYNRISFDYIPVPHESIPGDAVDALCEVLSHKAKPALLYCRTGRRAVRLFALAEASRPNGPSADAISQMVRAAGFSADDIQDKIDQRISHRDKTPAVKQ